MAPIIHILVSIQTKDLVYFSYSALYEIIKHRLYCNSSNFCNLEPQTLVKNTKGISWWHCAQHLAKQNPLASQM